MDAPWSMRPERWHTPKEEEERERERDREEDSPFDIACLFLGDANAATWRRESEIGLQAPISIRYAGASKRAHDTRRVPGGTALINASEMELKSAEIKPKPRMTVEPVLARVALDHEAGVCVVPRLPAHTEQLDRRRPHTPGLFRRGGSRARCPGPGFVRGSAKEHLQWISDKRIFRCGWTFSVLVQFSHGG